MPQAAGPFVVVLIDGDSTLFLDDFIQDGCSGGERAAKKLQEAIRGYLKDSLNALPHWKLVVRIYINKHGFVEAYTDSKTVSDARTVEQFIVGFDHALPLFEFVDAGADKEAVDNRIKENLAFYWADEQCKHVLLVGSADRGYVNPLRMYRGGERLTTKLVLVESVPFPRDFRKLADWFYTTSFENVFRSTKLVIPEQASPGCSARQTYATATVSSSNTQTRAQPTFNFPLTGTAGSYDVTCRKMLFNRFGQRIDERLHPWDDQILKRLKPKGLCARHFITNCDTPNCRESHDGRVDEEEKFALTRLTRDEPCKNGTVCLDRNCIAAHHCVYDGRCNYKDSCRYGREMHGIDKFVVTVG